jgi:hypothetical protein
VKEKVPAAEVSSESEMFGIGVIAAMSSGRLSEPMGLGPFSADKDELIWIGVPWRSVRVLDSVRSCALRTVYWSEVFRVVLGIKVTVYVAGS